MTHKDESEQQHGKIAWYLRDTIENRYEENKTTPPEDLTDEQIYLETEVIVGKVGSCSTFVVLVVMQSAKL